MNTTSFYLILLTNMVLQKRATWLPVWFEYCKWTCINSLPDQYLPQHRKGNVQWLIRVIWKKKKKLCSWRQQCTAPICRLIHSSISPDRADQPSPHRLLLLQVIWINQTCTFRTRTASVLRGGYMHPPFALVWFPPTPLNLTAGAQQWLCPEVRCGPLM